MNKKVAIANLVLSTILLSPAFCLADTISPHVKGNGQVYSYEPPNTAVYGTGIGGRYAEASMLRFEVERALQDAKYEEAIYKAKKAVQLDPGDPDGHIYLARALSAKFYKQKTVDEALLSECLSEWTMIWHYDANLSEQHEAKMQVWKLKRIAKSYNKEKERSKEEIAETNRKKHLRFF